MLRKLEITKENKFFIATCMEPNRHTFLCLGMMKDDICIPLVGIGKHIPKSELGRPNSCNTLYTFFKMSVGVLHSEIANEKFILGREDNKIRPITYLAFEIRYEDYYQFLKYLKYINSNIFAYQPNFEMKTKNIILEFKQLNEFPDDLKTIPTTLKNLYNNKDYFSFVKNCRAAAIELLSLVLSPKIHISSMISSNCLMSFPFSTFIRNGQFSDPLHALPLPPVDRKSAVLANSYLQLQKSIYIQYCGTQTVNNFIFLKANHLNLVESVEGRKALKLR
ncbi:MAG TPA: hypothetical protein VHM20_01960 [Gammaproteobacteria bacterium]|jgi:hypothetical protein|nr:hypothetical protein [Gammaproteobacteria bacterium]